MLILLLLAHSMEREGSKDQSSKYTLSIRIIDNDSLGYYTSKGELPQILQLSTALSWLVSYIISFFFTEVKSQYTRDVTKISQYIRIKQWFHTL